MISFAQCGTKRNNDTFYILHNGRFLFWRDLRNRWRKISTSKFGRRYVRNAKAPLYYLPKW